MRPLIVLALLVACDKSPIVPPTGGGGTTLPCVDADLDGVCDPTAACTTANGNDIDGDGICGDDDDDDDGDGCLDAVDALPNQPSGDDDGDGLGNHCDACPTDNPNDSDGDGVCNSLDVCEGHDDTADDDGDAVPNGCDPCPADAADDSDGDGVCDSADLCPGYADGFDVDGDGVPDWCDPCPGEYPNDSDGDGVCDSVDICPGGDDLDDNDGDGTPNGCDPCPIDNPDDSDGDGVCNSQDLCPGYVDGAFDADGDGFSTGQGDCNDCNPSRGPQMFDIPGSLIDEDCDGVVDGAPAICDSGLLLSSTDPYQGAFAMDLCEVSPPSPWGLITARYVRANGGTHSNPGLHTGLVNNFGAISVQEGNRMLALSTGRGRDATDSGNCGLDSCNGIGLGTAPAGYPQNVPGCAGGNTIYDDVGLQLTLAAPMNAVGFKMSFYFMSFEFPEWVCTDYNDQFVVRMDPAPVGAINGNIAVDSLSNPVSVNLAYMEVCDPTSSFDFAYWCTTGCPATPAPYCPLGDAELAGTGFDVWDIYAGGTGWLEVTAPVTPGQVFTLNLAIWDTGDANLDSTVLIDSFEWLADPVDVGVQPQP